MQRLRGVKRCRDCGASRRRAICVELSPSRGLGIAPGILVWTAFRVGVRQAEGNGIAAGQHRQGTEVFQPGQAALQVQAAILELPLAVANKVPVELAHDVVQVLNRFGGLNQQQPAGKVGVAG